MRPLRLVRHERASFDARFYERDPVFRTIARAASTFAGEPDWPEVEEYGRAFEGDAPVRFERAPPRRRRPRGEPVDRRSLYDARIVGDRVVPTRPRMWHDYLNALVWATFPRAKLALHARQHRAIQAWLPEGATALPNARTRELDTLALVDEGGVIVLDTGGDRLRLVFGHALYEGIVVDSRSMMARSFVLRAPPDRDDSSVEARAALADELLAGVLEDVSRLVSPAELDHVTL